MHQHQRGTRCTHTGGGCAGGSMTVTGVQRRRMVVRASGGVRVWSVLLLLSLAVGIALTAYTPPPAPTVPIKAAYSIERIIMQRTRPHRPSVGVVDDDPRRAVENATEVHQPEYDMRSYQVAIIRVELEDEAQSIVGLEMDSSVRNDIVPPSIPLASFPVHGLTRLLCLSTSQLFESYPAPNRHRHSLRVASEAEAAQRASAAANSARRSAAMSDAEKRRAAGFESPEEEQQETIRPPDTMLAVQPGPPVYLVPLHGEEMMSARERTSRGADPTDDDDSESLHPLYQLLSSTRPSSSHALEFALVLSYQYGSGSPSRKILSHSSLKTCRLQFLKPHTQIHKQRGIEREGGTYMNGDGKGERIVGTIPIRRETVEEEMVHDLSISSSNNAEAWSILDPFVHSPRSLDPWPSSVDASGADGADSDRLSLESRCQFDVDSPTVFLESDAEMYGTVASQTRGLMAGLCAPIVSAVTGTFDSIVGGFVLNAATEFLPSGIADSLVEQLTRSLPHMIARVIIPTIGTNIGGTLPIATESKITPYASHGISYKTTHDIVEDLTKNLVMNIHRLVDVEMPKSLAVLSGNIIPHLLGRSVVASTSSALTHTLAHSPLHDSFCMVCYEHQKQCEHCHFNQNKIFYALYYAEYYATYYSNYYWEYFSDLLLQDRIRVIEPAQHHAQDRLRYRRIYSDKGEQVTRTWRRGEPDTNVVPEPPPEPEPEPEPEAPPEEEPPPEPTTPPSLEGVNFEFDSSDLTPESHAILDNAATILKDKTTGTIMVEGHTDGKGSASYNQKLSERRAKSVSTYLKAAGVTVPFQEKGYGLTQPIASNDTEEGRAKNRRVELKFV